jgi:hypothetical protein
MATQSAAKRARVEIEVPSFDTLSLDEFSLKESGGGKNLYPSMAGESLRFNLTPTGWLQTVYGFDLNSKYEKPSFLGGKAPARPGAPEGLNLPISLTQKETDYLTDLDAKCQEAFVAKNKAAWSSLVSEASLFGGSKSTKVKVILNGENQTKLAVIKDNKVVRGQGWDFLKDHMEDCNSFKHAEVKLTVRAKKVWIVEGKAGFNLEATQLVLRPTERPTEMDAFANDAELLA